MELDAKRTVELALPVAVALTSFTTLLVVFENSFSS
jgi:hypothetical protein